MYIASALSYSNGTPFKKPFYTNFLFILNLVSTWLYSLAYFIWPSARMDLIEDNYDENFKLRVILVCNFSILILYIYECYIPN